MSLVSAAAKIARTPMAQPQEFPGSVAYRSQLLQLQDIFQEAGFPLALQPTSDPWTLSSSSPGFYTATNLSIGASGALESPPHI